MASHRLLSVSIYFFHRTGYMTGKQAGVSVLYELERQPVQRSQAGGQRSWAVG